MAYLCSDGGDDIGIKSRLIEWGRLEGRGGEYGSFRSNQRRPAGGEDVHDGPPWTGGLAGDCAGSLDVGRDWGSAALGLSECDMLGYSPADDGGSSYSRFVSLGREARIRRGGSHFRKNRRFPG